jgi:hypothetical protein
VSSERETEDGNWRNWCWNRRQDGKESETGEAW